MLPTIAAVPDTFAAPTFCSARAALGVLLGIAVVPAARAQWTVTNLNPPGSVQSYGIAACGEYQVGDAFFGGTRHACLWTGPTHTWVDLTPAGATFSRALACIGGQVAGDALFDGVRHAGLWNGPAHAWVDLNPTGSTESLVAAASGGQQAGHAFVDGKRRASLWTGTADSWVDLSPAAATESAAWGAHDGQQIGYARVGGVSRASLWTGTQASWVDLNPAGSVESHAYAASCGRQAGYAIVGGVYRASLWSGTAGSWVDLHPATSTESEAYAADCARQVGQALVGGVYHASLWSGTSSSWVDLHALLPSNYSTSSARAISGDTSNLIVAGFAYNTDTGRDEAVLWTRPLCPTPTITAQPVAVTVFRAQDALFFVRADDGSCGGTPTYQWRKDGVAINTVTNPSAATPALTLTGVQDVDSGFYNCEVTNPCGGLPTASVPVALTVLCPADYDRDGFVTGDDFDAFLVDFELGC